MRPLPQSDFASCPTLSEPQTLGVHTLYTPTPTSSPAVVLIVECLISFAIPLLSSNYRGVKNQPITIACKAKVPLCHCHSRVIDAVLAQCAFLLRQREQLSQLCHLHAESESAPTRTHIHICGRWWPTRKRGNMQKGGAVKIRRLWTLANLASKGWEDCVVHQKYGSPAPGSLCRVNGDSY